MRSILLTCGVLALSLAPARGLAQPVETTFVSEPARADVATGGRTREAWHVAPGSQVSLRSRGPGTLRLEYFQECRPGRSAPADVRLLVAIDGAGKMFPVAAKALAGAAFVPPAAGGRVPCAAVPVNLKIGPGEHQVVLRLAASAEAGGSVAFPAAGADAALAADDLSLDLDLGGLGPAPAAAPRASPPPAPAGDDLASLDPGLDTGMEPALGALEAPRPKAPKGRGKPKPAEPALALDLGLTPLEPVAASAPPPPKPAPDADLSLDLGLSPLDLAPPAAAKPPPAAKPPAPEPLALALLAPEPPPAPPPPPRVGEKPPEKPAEKPPAKVVEKPAAPAPPPPVPAKPPEKPAVAQKPQEKPPAVAARPAEKPKEKPALAARAKRPAPPPPPPEPEGPPPKLGPIEVGSRGGVALARSHLAAQGIGLVEIAYRLERFGFPKLRVTFTGGYMLLTGSWLGMEAGRGKGWMTQNTDLVPMEVGATWDVASFGPWNRFTVYAGAAAGAGVAHTQMERFSLRPQERASAVLGGSVSAGVRAQVRRAVLVAELRHGESIAGGDGGPAQQALSATALTGGFAVSF